MSTNSELDSILEKGEKGTHEMQTKNTTSIQPKSKHHSADKMIRRWWAGARTLNSLADGDVLQVCLSPAMTGTTTLPSGEKQKQQSTQKQSQNLQNPNSDLSFVQIFQPVDLPPLKAQHVPLWDPWAFSESAGWKCGAVLTGACLGCTCECAVVLQDCLNTSY